MWQGLPVAVKVSLFTQISDNKVMAMQEAAISKSIRYMGHV
jgi:hypothetical protein